LTEHQLSLETGLIWGNLDSSDLEVVTTISCFFCYWGKQQQIRIFV